VLTGTPIENRLSELWSIFNFINHGYLGSRTKFRKEFALPIENYQDQVALARLQRMARPFILRRLKTDPAVIQDLPDRLEMDVYCTLTDEQAALYQQVVDEGLPRIADASGATRRIHVFNLLTRLKQILNHPVQYLYKIGPNSIPAEPLIGRSGKLDRLTAMLEEVLEVGDKALIFTQFAEMGYLLSEHIRNTLETPILYLHGGVPGGKRQEMVNRFQEDPHAPPIFILTLKAGCRDHGGLKEPHVTHICKQHQCGSIHPLKPDDGQWDPELDTGGKHRVTAGWNPLTWVGRERECIDHRFRLTWMVNVGAPREIGGSHTDGRKPPH
jgi:SNF2 family DNA or RNA helicase